MWCMSSTGNRTPAPLQLHTVVDQPLTELAYGRITCRPMGIAPFRFAWHGPTGDTVQTDDSGAQAFGVVPGKYRVVVQDQQDRVADVTLQVEPVFPNAIVVRDYKVSHASTSYARDGEVEVVGYGFETSQRFLWSNGIETTGPVLRDVQVGVYVATALADDGKTLTVVHQCAPARVQCIT